MSLQILQKPLSSFAEETNSQEDLYENDHRQPAVEISQRVATSKWESCPAPVKLESEILFGTHQQVQNVKVRCDHSGITVYGVSPSYYLKQLVTQTVQTFAPSIPLVNRVLVHAK
ncbi:MAG: hypothetical protein ABIK07_14050 [Planctomycetota bacterium]